MIVQKLYKVLNGIMTAQSLCRREPATEQELNAATEHLEEEKHEVWFELVNVLDNKSVNFVRKYKGDVRTAWRPLQDRFRSSEKLQFPSLHQSLMNGTMNHKENVADYLIRCENLYYELRQVEQVMSDTMFKSKVLGS